MDGHPMMQEKKQPTTKAPIRHPMGIFAHNPLFDGVEDNIDNQQKNQQQKPSTHDYGMDMDATYDNSGASSNGGSESAYEEPSNQLPFATNVDFQYDLPAINSPNSNFLIGPMVVRVRPDGTAVEEDKKKPLPIDDDREAMTIGTGFFPSSRTPSVHLEAPAAPVATHVAPVSRARLMPDTSAYTNYRTITRRHYQH